MNFTGDLAIELKGRAGEEVGLGIASAYVKGCLLAADKHGRTYLNSILLFEEIDKFLDNPLAVNFLHIFLDPREGTTTDEFLGSSSLFKIRFVFCTTNYDLKIEAIRDRFEIYVVGIIPLEYKISIIKDSIVPPLAKLFSHPVLLRKYAHYFKNEEITKCALEGAMDFLETKGKNEPGVRGLERAAHNKCMTEVVKKLKAEQKTKKAARNKKV